MFRRLSSYGPGNSRRMTSVLFIHDTSQRMIGDRRARIIVDPARFSALPWRAESSHAEAIGVTEHGRLGKSRDEEETPCLCDDAHNGLDAERTFCAEGPGPSETPV